MRPDLYTFGPKMQLQSGLVPRQVPGENDIDKIRQWLEGADASNNMMDVWAALTGAQQNFVAHEWHHLWQKGPTKKSGEAMLAINDSMKYILNGNLPPSILQMQQDCYTYMESYLSTAQLNNLVATPQYTTAFATGAPAWQTLYEAILDPKGKKKEDSHFEPPHGDKLVTIILNIAEGKNPYPTPPINWLLLAEVAGVMIGGSLIIYVIVKL
jgi:hypothetical protein